MASRASKRRLRALETELQAVHEAITNLYWTFTRTARGKPPCVVRPDLYVRQRELKAAIRALRFQSMV